MTATGLVLTDPGSPLPRTDESPTARELVLKAPLSGFLVPIEQVPDPVFAQKLVGDGIAIDPVRASLLAPCDGEVVMLHPAHHALTLKTAEGLEVLMHIGLDTINLKGEGFSPKVKNGSSRSWTSNPGWCWSWARSTSVPTLASFMGSSAGAT